MKNNQSVGELYYTVGTVSFKDKDRTAVMNPVGELLWVEKRLINNFREGAVVWLVYKKNGQERVTETVIPFEDAKEEDLSSEFHPEKTR